MTKYGNHKISFRGHIFDSKKELHRFLALEDDQKRGIISNLVLQPEFEFVINGVLVCKYIADYAYVKNGEKIVEDVKNPATRKAKDYRIKVKLMLAHYGIEVKET